jgi:hypothetical protein
MAAEAETAGEGRSGKGGGGGGGGATREMSPSDMEARLLIGWR